MAASKKRRKNLPTSSPTAPSFREQKRQLITEAHQFSGPIPPPEVLAKYNEVVPDAAERIISMAENQSKHRQDLESKAVSSDIENSRRGLIFGLIIGLTAVIGGTVCAVTAHQIAGSVIGGGGLTSLVGVFVYGTKTRRQEREQRLKAVDNR